MNRTDHLRAVCVHRTANYSLGTLFTDGRKTVAAFKTRGIMGLPRCGSDFIVLNRDAWSQRGTMRFMQSTLQFDPECRDGRCVEPLGAEPHLNKRSAMDDILGAAIERLLRLLVCRHYFSICSYEIPEPQHRYEALVDECGEGGVLACLER